LLHRTQLSLILTCCPLLPCLPRVWLAHSPARRQAHADRSATSRADACSTSYWEVEQAAAPMPMLRLFVSPSATRVTRPVAQMRCGFRSPPAVLPQYLETLAHQPAVECRRVVRLRHLHPICYARLHRPLPLCLRLHTQLVCAEHGALRDCRRGGIVLRKRQLAPKRQRLLVPSRGERGACSSLSATTSSTVE